MKRLRLLASRCVTPPVSSNRRPYADWFADVTRRIEKRTGSWRAVNLMSSAYWMGCYHAGESAWAAADTFIEESRNVL